MVCAMFFDVTFLKKKFLKNGIIFAHFFHIEHTVFWKEIFFAIEVKTCACTRSKNFCSMENFPEWKSAFKFLYDTNITFWILHLNIFLTFGGTDVLFESKRKMTHVKYWKQKYFKKISIYSMKTSSLKLLKI